MSTLTATTIKATTIQHTNGTNALGIDSSGRVTRPNSPAFYVEKTYGNLNTFVSGNTSALGTWNLVRLNRGNNFNLSTARFTAPVAGVYLFTFHLSSNVATTDNSDYVFYKNGSAVSEAVVNKSGGAASGLWLNMALIMHIDLAVNDYVTLGSAAYNTNTGTVRASFGGSLIG